MRKALASVFGDVSLRDCLISALLVIVLVVPITCAIHPQSEDDLFQTSRN